MFSLICLLQHVCETNCYSWTYKFILIINSWIEFPLVHMSGAKEVEIECFSSGEGSYELLDRCWQLPIWHLRLHCTFPPTHFGIELLASRIIIIMINLNIFIGVWAYCGLPDFFRNNFMKNSPRLLKSCGQTSFQGGLFLISG